VTVPRQAKGPAVASAPGLERLPLVNGGRTCDGRHYPVKPKQHQPRERAYSIWWHRSDKQKARRCGAEP
jgi:hypothetical protein